MIQDSILTIIAAWIAALAAAFSLLWSVITQKKIQENEIKRATIDAFNRLQSEVLDKLALMDRKNAEIIVEERENNEDCRQAYYDYKTLVARLEHFAVGINQGVYDLDVVDKLAGEHLVFLLPKIEPIIEAANDHVHADKYYQNYTWLIEQLEKRHRQ